MKLHLRQHKCVRELSLLRVLAQLVPRLLLAARVIVVRVLPIVQTIHTSTVVVQFCKECVHVVERNKASPKRAPGSRPVPSCGRHEV